MVTLRPFRKDGDAVLGKVTLGAPSTTTFFG